MSWKLITAFFLLEIFCLFITAGIASQTTMSTPTVFAVFGDPLYYLNPWNLINLGDLNHNAIVIFFNALVFNYGFLNDGWHIYIRYFLLAISAGAFYAFICTIITMIAWVLNNIIPHP